MNITVIQPKVVDADVLRIAHDIATDLWAAVDDVFSCGDKYGLKEPVEEIMRLAVKLSDLYDTRVHAGLVATIEGGSGGAG